MAAENDPSTYDAGQIFAEHLGMPSHDWHSAALLRLIERSCILNPFIEMPAGITESPLRRAVSATTSLARIAERGYDIDAIVRQAFGKYLVAGLMSMVIDLRWNLTHSPEDLVPPYAEGFAEIMVGCATDPAEFLEKDAFFRAVSRDPLSIEVVVKIQRWVDEAPLADLVTWNVPLGAKWSALPGAAAYEPPPPDHLSLWMNDRLLGTYLTGWSTESLHLEFRYQESEPIAPVSLTEMSLRSVDPIALREEIALRAARPSRSENSGRPSSMAALSYLIEGDRRTAVAVLEAAQMADPTNSHLASDLAFCQVPDHPAKAAVRLERLLSIGHQPALTQANLISCAVAQGDEAQASERLATLIQRADRLDQSCWLWTDLAGEPRPVVVEVEHLIDHLAAEVRSVT